MKRLLISVCFIFLCLPALAWNELAAFESIEYLNNLVAPNVASYMQTLNSDYVKIQQIKKNKNLKQTEINKFANACVNRNKGLLKLYRTRYFKPAYNKYIEIDKSMSFENFIDSVAISEISTFYQFYGFTEANLRACEALTSR